MLLNLLLYPSQISHRKEKKNHIFHSWNKHHSWKYLWFSRWSNQNHRETRQLHWTFWTRRFVELHGVVLRIYMAICGIDCLTRWFITLSKLSSSKIRINTFLIHQKIKKELILCSNSLLTLFFAHYYFLNLTADLLHSPLAVCWFVYTCQHLHN